MSDAVVLPGRAWGVGAPLPRFTGDLAEERGATVHRLSWAGSPPDVSDVYAQRWVCDQVLPVLDRIGGRPLLIGKSLGTRASVLAAERDLPAVWVSPLLASPLVTAGLRRATAPFLLVGGTGDRLWDGELARRLTPHVYEVAGADERMSVPGRVRASITLLAQVVAAMGEFLDEIGWPYQPRATL